MVVYVVTWGAGLMNEDDGLSIYCGCTGVFTDRKKAEEAMLKERDQFIDELYEPYEEIDEGEEMEEWVANRLNHELYGSPKEDYLEVDWGTDCEADTDQEEIYIKIEEKIIS